MRLPVLPTLMVALGVPVLIALGLWQLDRREEKRSALEAFARPEQGAWACDPLEGPLEQRAGRSGAGRSGWAHSATCRVNGEPVRVILGWASNPVAYGGLGGPRRIIGAMYELPDRHRLLVATESPEPLTPAAQPSAADIPNNHLAYAVQWFAFAATLAVVYALWLRRWRREQMA